MIQKLNWKCCAQLVVVVLCAYAVKSYFSTATVNQLCWILAPTAVVVEFVTGSNFEFESHSGYINEEQTFVIAASCSGVNFLIMSFLMLALRKLWHERSNKVSWRYFACAALCSYMATIFANTVRISTALQMDNTSLTWLNQQQLHRFEGIFIYFGCLLLMFMLVEKLSSKAESNTENTFSLIRRTLCPLLIYYAMTLGVPILNGAYRQGTEFWEHSLFVLAVPILFIVPIASFSFYRLTTKAEARF